MPRSKHTFLVIVLTLGYGVILALLLDPHVVPGLIKAAHRGESWEPINRILEGRSQYPLEHYMDKWHARSRILVVALIGAAAATLAARLAWGRSRQVILFAVMAPALALLASVTGASSSWDYLEHLKMWGRTLAGGDPWAIDTPEGYSMNSYGPLFNLLAMLAALDPIAPKVLYALVWAAAIAVLASRDWWIALAVAPMGLCEAVRGGRFDILVAICLLAALRDYLAGRDVAAGVWLGVGFLLKLVPLAVLPFLALDGRRLRWRLAWSALTVSAVGFALAIWIWGWQAPLRSLLFNAQRPSQADSAGLFAFTRYVMGFDLDRWSGPTIAVSLTALMVWSVARRPAPVPTALAAILLLFTFHKMGSRTYPVMLAVPLSWYVTERTDRMLRLATILYAGWVSSSIVIWGSEGLLASTGLPYMANDITLATGLLVCLINLALVTVLLRRAGAVDQEKRRVDCSTKTDARPT
jgi:hypothetical protein